MDLMVFSKGGEEEEEGIGAGRSRKISQEARSIT